MKLRNIAVAFAATILTFASCVEESVITPEGKTEAGLPTTLNLSIATDGLITKAAPGGYVYANADELLINRLAIAIFRDYGDDGVGERVGFGYATFEDGVANAECPDNTDRPAYSLSNIPAKTGDVKILVIANSTYSKDQLEAAKTYEGFKGLMETNPDDAEGKNYTFDQKELVKSGEFKKTLGTGHPQLHLELKQLAARIELKFEVNVPEEDPRYEADSTYTKQALVDAVNKKIIDSGSSGNPNLVTEDYYTDGSGGSTKHLIVKNNKVTERWITPKWAYDITSLTIENINTMSDPILGDYTKGNSSSYTYNTQELLAEPYELEFDPEDRIASVVFYSYEKKYQTPSPLKITVGGNLVYRENIVSQTTYFSSEYDWVNNKGETNGWGPTPGYFSAEKHKIKSQDGLIIGDPIDVTVPEPRSYEAIINPKETETGKDETNSNTFGIVHGNTYEVKGLIDTKNRSVNFTINVIPWSARPVTIGAEIMDIHYLFVKETNVVMANVADYFVDYKSDTPLTDASITNWKATFVEYVRNKTTNVVSSRDATVDPAQYSFSIENGRIKIHSDIPGNYFPRKLSFDVTNTHGLTEHVEITQYPPQYLTAQISANSGPADSPDGKTNPNIFTINIIAAEGLQVGVSKGTNGKTLTSEAANNLISPKFMVASRYGVVNGNKYSSNSAITRCSNYWETLNADEIEDKATYPIGTWRVPTLAELEFMNTIQDSDGIVNYLFNNTGEYWSARQDTDPTRAWYYDFGNNKRNYTTSLTTTRSALYIRCVHDVY